MPTFHFLRFGLVSAAPSPPGLLGAAAEEGQAGQAGPADPETVGGARVGGPGVRGWEEDGVGCLLTSSREQWARSPSGVTMSPPSRLASVLGNVEESWDGKSKCAHCTNSATSLLCRL